MPTSDLRLPTAEQAAFAITCTSPGASDDHPVTGAKFSSWSAVPGQEAVALRLEAENPLPESPHGLPSR